MDFSSLTKLSSAAVTETCTQEDIPSLSVPVWLQRGSAENPNKPAWTFTLGQILSKQKPKQVTWLFHDPFQLD